MKFKAGTKTKGLRHDPHIQKVPKHQSKLERLLGSPAWLLDKTLQVLFLERR